MPAIIALFAAVLVSILIGTAFAQSTDGLDHTIELWCANNGAWVKMAVDNPISQWAIGLLVTSVVASFIANFRKKIPAPVMRVVDTLALNLVEAMAKSPAPEPAVPAASTQGTKP